MVAHLYRNSPEVLETDGRAERMLKEGDVRNRASLLLFLNP
jgi:hypothetical protein